ncbi:conserved domain protein [Paenibacillus sp. HGF5]|nr:conserved domain protein [Paenibacillus sp. HGF5]
MDNRYDKTCVCISFPLMIIAYYPKGFLVWTIIRTGHMISQYFHKSRRKTSIDVLSQKTDRG